MSTSYNGSLVSLFCQTGGDETGAVISSYKKLVLTTHNVSTLENIKRKENQP